MAAPRREIDPSGFHRKLLVVPKEHRVTTAVEDDFHCMVVTLEHDGAEITSVEARMLRWPWTTCPGAEAVLKVTFEGVALADAAARGDKKVNCTHLHDLAVLGAAHAFDNATLSYDIFVSDAAEDGSVFAEIRRDGELQMQWTMQSDVMVSPVAIKGRPLFDLRTWIADLRPDEREAARLLQWGAIIAHGRAIPMEQQSDATRMPANCHTFQPQQAAKAQRIGKVTDFSHGDRKPLDWFAEADG